MSTEVEPCQRSLRGRLALGAAGLVALILAAVAASSASRSSQSRSHLKAVTDALDEAEPGWRLEDLEAARATPPPGKNSAAVVQAVWKKWFPRGRTTSVYSALRVPQPTQLLAGGPRKRLADELGKLELALAEARRLAAMPTGRYEIDFTSGPPSRLDGHVVGVHLVSDLMCLDTRLHAEDGDPRRALLSWRAALNAARSLGDEPLRFSQGVRRDGVVAGLSELERVLALTEPADADLAAVATLLSDEERHPEGRICAKAARAGLHHDYLSLEESPPSARGLQLLLSGGREGLASWRDSLFGVSVTDLRFRHALGLELLTERVEASRLPPHEQPAREAEVRAKFKGVMARHRFDYVSLPDLWRENQEFRRKLALTRAMLVLLAVERSRLRGGGWPASLAAVPKDLLAATPLDPYDGEPLRYRRTADGVVAYSVGEDGRDDGGEVAPKGPKKAPDLGYRLWDVKKRRQPPGPAR